MCNIIRCLNLKIYEGISGNHTDNCIRLDTWLNANTKSVTLEFASDDSKHQNRGIDISAMCMSRANQTSFTWEDRRNAFEEDEECFECGPCHKNARCIVGEGEFTCHCHRGTFFMCDPLINC